MVGGGETFSVYNMNNLSILKNYILFIDKGIVHFKHLMHLVAGSTHDTESVSNLVDF